MSVFAEDDLSKGSEQEFLTQVQSEPAEALAQDAAYWRERVQTQARELKILRDSLAQAQLDFDAVQEELAAVRGAHDEAGECTHAHTHANHTRLQAHKVHAHTLTSGARTVDKLSTARELAHAAEDTAEDLSGQLLSTREHLYGVQGELDELKEASASTRRELAKVTGERDSELAKMTAELSVRAAQQLAAKRAKVCVYPDFCFHRSDLCVFFLPVEDDADPPPPSTSKPWMSSHRRSPRQNRGHTRR